MQFSITVKMLLIYYVKNNQHSLKFTRVCLIGVAKRAPRGPGPPIQMLPMIKMMI